MTKIITSTDKEPIYTAYLQLNPFFKGALFCVTDFVDEQIYKTMVQQHKLFTRQQDGVVQIGHMIDSKSQSPITDELNLPVKENDQSDSIGIKTATANLNYLNDLIIYVMQIGKGIVENGVEQSFQGEDLNYFKNKPIPQLKPSLVNTQVYTSPEVEKEYANAIKVIHTPAVQVVEKSLYLNKAYKRAFLIPEGYEAQYI